MADIEIATIKDRLAALWLLVNGVSESYARAPNSIIGANMPLVVILTGDGPDENIARGVGPYGYARTNRLFRSLFYLGPMLTGIPGEREEEAEPFFQSVRRFFLGRRGLAAPGLPALEWVEDLTFEGDNGLVYLSYAQEDKYIGIEFRMRVAYLTRYAFPDSN